MRFCVLGSGSKGNATYVESGKTRILIDAGFSGKEIQRRLQEIEVDAVSLSAIIITHEHTDHIRGVSPLSRKYNIPVFGNDATLQGAGAAFASIADLRAFSNGTAFAFQDILIHPYSISHDAADPVGFVVSNGRCSIGYCTDTGIVSRLMRHRLAGCNALILESNHDPVMLRNGPYPLYLQQRVRSNTGHLANGEAADFLRDIMHDGLEYVVLAHISEKNNTPELARKAVDKALQASRGNNELRVAVAAQNKTGEPVTVTGRAS